MRTLDHIEQLERELCRQSSVATTQELLSSLVNMMGVNKSVALTHILLADTSTQDQIILDAYNARKLIGKNIAHSHRVQLNFDNLLVDVYNETSNKFQSRYINGRSKNNTVKKLVQRCDEQRHQLIMMRAKQTDVSIVLNELLTTYRELHATLALL